MRRLPQSFENCLISSDRDEFPHTTISFPVLNFYGSKFLAAAPPRAGCGAGMVGYNTRIAADPMPDYRSPPALEKISCAVCGSESDFEETKADGTEIPA
jgi:hypothetical protein